MIKNYINVRIFILIDACLLATWIMLSIGGWEIIKKYAIGDAAVWAILSIPLALIGVYSIFQRSQLVHSKHRHELYIHQQEQEFLLEERRQKVYPPTLSIEEEKNNEPVKRLSHVSTGRETPQRNVSSFQGVSSETPGETPVGDNCNVAVAYYLADHPGASIREIARETNYSIATINRTPAWKNRGR